jgi:hypothetical protein
VSGWAERGIPLQIALRGVDRCAERYHAKGPRRRPLRIEFCEADVLDAFDAWRRAVGLRGRSAAGLDGEVEGAGSSRRHALAPHLERVVARLAAVRGERSLSGPVDAALTGLILEVDALRGRAKGARGAARDALMSRLAELDADLLATARQMADPVTLDAAAREALEQLEPFRGRMREDDFRTAVAACEARNLRTRLGLPHLMLE